jgi:hypothetical protein
MQIPARCRAPLGALAATLAGAIPLAGQTPATTPAPAVLQVFEEVIKPGHVGAHAITEAEWPRVFAETGAPVYYIALSSLTGDLRMWFLSGWADFEEMDASDKAVDEIMGLGNRLEQLSAQDGEHLTQYSSWIARYVPDLSYDGKALDLPHARWMQVTTLHAHPGKDEVIAEISRRYVAKAKALGLATNWAVYRGQYGLPGGTWLILSTGRELPEFDIDTPANLALMASFTPTELAELADLVAEGVASATSNLWQFAPRLSHVSKEFAAEDPEYWSSP